MFSLMASALLLARAELPWLQIGSGTRSSVVHESGSRKAAARGPQLCPLRLALSQRYTELIYLLLTYPN